MCHDGGDTVNTMLALTKHVVELRRSLCQALRKVCAMLHDLGIEGNHIIITCTKKRF